MLTTSARLQDFVYCSLVLQRSIRSKLRVPTLTVSLYKSDEGTLVALHFSCLYQFSLLANLASPDTLTNIAANPHLVPPTLQI